MTFYVCVVRYQVQPKVPTMSDKHVMGTRRGRKGSGNKGPEHKVHILMKGLYAPSTRVVWRVYDAECGFINKRKAYKCTWYAEDPEKNPAKNNYEIKEAR